MESLHISGTDETPEILLDRNSGRFEISGRSLPEDSVEFYKPVLEWLEHYKKKPNSQTEFAFKLDYINTASSKLIQDILLSLEKINGVKVLWYHQKDDEDMEAMGREYAELINLPFDFRSVSP
ncbi:MAG: DUF1987 domain-containing protein [Bacteroidota bacterium]